MHPIYCKKLEKVFDNLYSKTNPSYDDILKEIQSGYPELHDKLQGNINSKFTMKPWSFPEDKYEETSLLFFTLDHICKNIILNGFKATNMLKTIQSQDPEFINEEIRFRGVIIAYPEKLRSILADQNIKVNTRCVVTKETPLHLLLLKSQVLYRLHKSGFLAKSVANIAVDVIVELGKVLLEKGANINAKDWLRNAPLHNASFIDEKLLIFLLENEARVDAKNCFWETPLHKAAENGDEKFANTLLEKGASVDAKDCFGETPLHRAAEKSDLEMAKLLLKNGASVDSKDNSGKTPLHRATEKGDLEMAKLLLKNGASIYSRNNSGQTPLHLTSKHTSVAMASLLVKNQANISETDHSGKTLFDLSVDTGNVKVLAFLLKKGVRPSTEMNETEHSQVLQQRGV
ncbi:ankyrin repeat domain-containing protein [Wolbachia endosymbiont of Folsomia candida]|uniref:ankyrin repeat domain-containing protein n=1 Tax=Wolbachia endosymbiont of Folsomia candida TaxID=169402 RepID=UPI000AD748F4|nr:ankyrin repeat domain-containing protein [Wolbachia endosymbiont of Folsomia candida]APR98288.1 hypothetical protein ASM33_03210 [Wolbachia endosymbiont of Folsomia candida]